MTEKNVTYGRHAIVGLRAEGLKTGGERFAGSQRVSSGVSVRVEKADRGCLAAAFLQDGAPLARNASRDARRGLFTGRQS